MKTTEQKIAEAKHYIWQTKREIKQDKLFINLVKNNPELLYENLLQPVNPPEIIEMYKDNIKANQHLLAKQEQGLAKLLQEEANDN